MPLANLAQTLPVTEADRANVDDELDALKYVDRMRGTRAEYPSESIREARERSRRAHLRVMSAYDLTG